LNILEVVLMAILTGKMQLALQTLDLYLVPVVFSGMFPVVTAHK